MAEKIKIPKSVLITAICCLTFLEAIALCNGINGTLFALVVAAIAGMGGWVIPAPNSK